MSSIFISFCAADGRPAADSVSEALRDQGYSDSDIFVFDSVRYGTPPGDAWEMSFLARLMTYDAMIVLTTPASLVSARCAQEITIARLRDIPVVEVALACAGHPLAHDLHRIAVTDIAEPAVHGIIDFLERRQIEPFGGLPAAGNPYPGLRAFDEDRAAYFYGRDREIGDTVRWLNGTSRDGGGLAFVGQSGTGKSSLVRAGVVPALRSGDHLFAWSIARPFVPGDRPSRALAEAVAELAGSAGDADVIARVTVAMRPDGGLGDVLADILPTERGRRRLLVLDQAEELIDHESADDVRALADALAEVARRRRAWILYTLRSDRLGDFQDHPTLRHLVTDLQPVETVGAAELSSIITEPAKRRFWRFDGDAVGEILTDVRDEPALPLLAYALSELWTHVTTGHRVAQEIHRHDYLTVGRVQELLARRADLALADACVAAGADPADQASLRLAESTVLTLLRSLARVDRDGRFNRRPVPLEHFADQRHLIDPFIAARVLSLRASEGGRADHADMLEVSHEALLRQWDKLADELAKVAKALQHTGEAERRRADWDSTGRQADALIPASMLVDLIASLDPDAAGAGVRTWAAADEALAALGVAAGDRDFVAESLDHVLLSEVERVRRDVDSRPEVAMRAVAGGSELQADVIDVLVTAPHVEPLVEVLHEVMAAHPLHLAVAAHDGGAWSVRWHADGRRFATAGRDQSAAIWDADTTDGTWEGCLHRCPHGEESDSEEVRTSWVRSVAWSSPPDLLFSAATDHTVRVWAPDTGSDVRVLGHDDRLWSVDAAATSSTHVVTGSADGQLRLYQAGRPMSDSNRTWRAPAQLWYAAIDRAGRRVAVACRDHFAYVYDLDDPDRAPTAIEHPGQVRSVAWAPDGGTLATGCQDSVVRIIDAHSPETVASLRGHGDQVRAVRFSPAGRRLASASADGTVRVWDLTTAETVAVLAPHGQGVCDIDWSPDGDRLLSAADDGWVRLWKVGPESAVLRSADDPVTALSWSPEREQVAVAVRSSVPTVTLLDLAGVVASTQVVHDDAISSVQWTSDGLLTSSADHTVVRWPSNGGKRHYEPLTSVRGPMNAAAESPNHDYIVAVGNDRVIRRWHSNGHAIDDGGRQLHLSFTRDLAWAPDGRRFAVVAEDGTVSLTAVTPDAGQERVFDVAGLPIAVAWSPDGQFLAIGMKDGSIEVRAVGDEIDIAGSRTWRHHRAEITGLSWSPDSRHLCSVDRTGRGAVWDTATGAVRTTLLGHRGRVAGCCWTSHREVVTGGQDGTVRRWRLSDIVARPLAGLPDADETSRGGDRTERDFAAEARALLEAMSARVAEGSVGHRG